MSRERRASIFEVEEKAAGKMRVPMVQMDANTCRVRAGDLPTFADFLDTPAPHAQVGSVMIG